MCPSPYFSQADSELLSVLDPEPILVTYITGLVPPFPKVFLTRVISWHHAKDNDLHRLFEDYPFVEYSKVVTHKHLFYSSIRAFETRFGVLGQKPITPVQANITETNWYLKLWGQGNRLAHPYAPKYISTLIGTNLKEGKLHVCYHTVAKDCWYPLDCNPLEVVPRTPDNFKNVIEFQLKSALADWEIIRNSPQYRPL